MVSKKMYDVYWATLYLGCHSPLTTSSHKKTTVLN